MALMIPENDEKQKVEGPKLGFRVNYFIILAGGFLLLVGGIVVFLLIVKNVYGSFDISEVIPSKENLDKIVYEEKAAILYPQYTENRFEEGNTWVQDNVEMWKSYLNIIKMGYDIISDLDIETGKHFKYKLLILPGAQAISDREIIQIKKYLDQGGSVFATGGTASYSDEGKWRGWEFFTETYGLSFTKEIKPDELYKIHTLRGNLPLTAGIPTGYTLKIATWDRPIYASILEPRVNQASFWYDYRREAGLVREEIKKSAGIAYGNYGKGRFVWFGFELTSVIGKQEEYVNFEKLFRNSINWLLYKPTVLVKDWPAPYEAAAIIVPMIDSSPSNIRNVLSILKSNNIDASFFVEQELALKNKSLLKTISKYGSLGIIADIGFLESTNDTANKLYDKVTQYYTIKEIKDTIQKATGVPIKGFMPKFGFYDENTLQAMSQNNMDLLVTDSLTDRSVPKLEIRNENPILIITKTARDDIEIIKNYGLYQREFQVYTYNEDVDRLVFEGGLYVWKMHTSQQLRPENVGAVNEIISYMKKKNVWITSVSELINWWKRKQGLEVTFQNRGPRRISLEVSNPRDSEMTNFSVQVNVNKKIKNIKVSSDLINTKLPKVNFDDATNTLYLFIEKMKAHETNSYIIDFENVNEKIKVNLF